MYFTFNQANNLISNVLWLRVKITLATQEFGIALQTNHAVCAKPLDHPVICLPDSQERVSIDLETVIYAWKKQTKQNNKQNKTTNKKEHKNLISLSNRQK